MRKVILGVLGMIGLGMLCSGGFFALTGAFFGWLEGFLPAPARPPYRAWLLGQSHPDLHVGGDAWEGEIPYLGGVCAPSGLPAPGPIVLDFGEIYGPNVPGGLAGKPHAGIDIAVPVGTPVRSPISGRVAFAAYDLGWPSYGNLVVVCNGPVCVYLGHLSEIGVAPGQEVQAGAVVGRSGNTGTSTGPHLHYEVRLHGRPVNPRALDPVAAACAEAARKASAGGGGGGDAWRIRRAPKPGDPWGWLRYYGEPARIYPEGFPEQGLPLQAGEVITVSMPITFEIEIRAGSDRRRIPLQPGEAVDVLR